VSLLDNILGIKGVTAEGEAVTKRPEIDFRGSVVVEDDPATKRTRVTVSGGVVGVTVVELFTRQGNYEGEPLIARQYDVGKPRGGGLFYWVSASGKTHDGGTVVGTVGVGRWERVYSGAVDVTWFGAMGDGSANDTAVIQAVLNAFNDVFVPVGTFMTNRLLIPSNRTLTGAGWQSVLKLRDSQATALLVNSTWVTGNENIHIRNLKLDGNSDNNILSIAGRGHCVLFLFADNCSVEGCYMYNPRQDGVYVGGAGTYGSGMTIGGPCTRITIINNRIEHAIRNGVSITRGQDIKVHFNEIIDANYGAIDEPELYGAAAIDSEPNVDTDDVDRISILGNTIYNGHFHGILCAGDGTHNSMQINDNNVHLAATATPVATGIGVTTGVTSVSVVGNAVSGGALHGISWGTSAERGIIANNMVSCDIAGSGGRGIGLTTGSGRCVISGNDVSGFEAAIAVVGTSEVHLGDVLVAGNILSVPSGNDYVQQRFVDQLVCVGNLRVGTGTAFAHADNLNDISFVTKLQIGVAPIANAIANHCFGSKTHDWPSVAAGQYTTTTVTVTGCVLGDMAEASMSAALPAGARLHAEVTAADTVTVTLHNYHASNAADPSSGTLRAHTWHH
jgi:hypothetical protein